MIMNIHDFQGSAPLTGNGQPGREETGAQYLKRVYGVTPDVVEFPADADAEEMERLAVKYDLTKVSDFTLAKAKLVLASIGR